MLTLAKLEESADEMLQVDTDWEPEVMEGRA